MANLNPLFRLPLEVRAQIYDYLLTCDEYRINPQQDGTNPPTRPQLYPSILATNKQINQEATGVLYHRNPWIVISIMSANQPTERQVRVPCLEIPGRIRQRLQNRSTAPGLVLLVRVVDGNPGDATGEDDTGRTTREFMLDFRSFSRLCRLNLFDCFFQDRYVVPAFEYNNPAIEKVSRFYAKVIGCLGEANGRNYALKEPSVGSNGVLKDEDGDDRSSDLTLLSYGYYKDVAPLLRRMDYYEKESCRLEKIGSFQAAQCLRLDCLELAEYGGEMFYSAQEFGDEMADKDEMRQLHDRIMSLAILCATASLDIGNIEMIACVQTKVKNMTGGGTYSMDDFRFKPTDDYKVIMDQCCWRMLRDQYIEGPPTVQEMDEMMQYRSTLAAGADPWGVYNPGARDFIAQYFWPEAASSKPNPASASEDMSS